MNKKRVVSLSLVASMMLGSAACASKETTTTAPTTTAPDKIETSATETETCNLSNVL